MKDSVREIIKWDDISYRCVIEHDSREFYHINFEVIEVVGYESGSHEKPVYPIKGYQGSSELAENLEEAQVFMSGEIKWDGCMNLNFNENCEERRMLHFCGFESAEKIGVILKRLYLIANSKMPGNEDLMGISKEEP